MRTSAAAAITPEAPPLLDLAEEYPLPDGYTGVYALDGAIMTPPAQWDHATARRLDAVAARYLRELSDG